ncbi:serine hydroxymethyltransferase-like protein [Xylaria venustula]|nr:serine hydroxymethyltransferase-like protein [Xylaria venustula]
MSLFRTARRSAAISSLRRFSKHNKNLTNMKSPQSPSQYAHTRSLEVVDPTVFKLLRQEEIRQKSCLNLIASENIMSPAVLDALGSVVQNKSSEGYPGARYHSCCTNIDKIETLCQSRALEAFGLRGEEWSVNVQSMSGSNANLYVYSALLECHDRIMGLDLAHGGHLTHGYRKGRKKVSNTSKYFETLPYYLDSRTGLIDYDSLEALAEQYQPRIIVAGTSAYSRLIDYARIKKITSKIDAYLMSDISHISGLVVAGLIPSPFEHSDIVTSSTAKLLQGPRGGIIFCRRGSKRTGAGTIENAINASVFPGHQSSPHNNTTAALSVALQQAIRPEFKQYQKQVLLNAKALAETLTKLGYSLASGGTDTHLVLLDLKPNGIDGGRLEQVLETVGVASNRNVLYGDTSAKEPRGLRIGSPAMTARGVGTQGFVEVAKLIDRAVEVTQKLSFQARKQAEGAGEKEPADLKHFFQFIQENNGNDMIRELRAEIASWVKQFAT